MMSKDIKGETTQVTLWLSGVRKLFFTLYLQAFCMRGSVVL